MEDCEPVKLLLIGDGTVGKSQLLIRYLASRFDPNFIVTIGVHCQHATVPHDGNLVKVQIWDAAGQEKFRTISPAYYAKAHAVMIVYDITNHSSFRNVEYWKQQVDTHSGHDDSADVPIVVVGNKTDLVDEHTMSLRVSMDEEESLSDKLGVPFRPASAKKGNGVHEAFNELIDLAVQRHFSHNGRCFFQPKQVRASALTRVHNSMVQRCRQSFRLSQNSALSKQTVPQSQPSVGSVSNHTRPHTGHGQSPALVSSDKDSTPRVEPATTRSAVAVCTDVGELGVATDDRLIKIMPCETAYSHGPAQIVHLPIAQAYATKKNGAHSMPDVNHLLASQASRESNTEAAALSLGRVGIPNLGIHEEVDNVEFDGDGGQSPLPLANAECGMAGVVTSPWVSCMNECCQYDGQSPLKK